MEKKELAARLEALASSTQEDGPPASAIRRWVQAVERRLTRGKEAR